jgi:hypothetical protein
MIEDDELFGGIGLALNPMSVQPSFRFTSARPLQERNRELASHCRPACAVLFFSVLSWFGINPACSDHRTSHTLDTQRTQQ